MGLLVTIAAVAGCGPGAATTTSQTAAAGYRLTHTAADTDHILSWDQVIATCPEFAGKDTVQGFVTRGQTVDLSTGEQITLGMDSPAAWGSTQIVRADDTRSFAIEILFYDKPEYLEEYLAGVAQGGFILINNGDFVIGHVETHKGTESSQMVVAGRQFSFSITQTAPEGDTLLSTSNETNALVSLFEQNVDALQITTLPWTIPQRQT